MADDACFARLYFESPHVFEAMNQFVEQLNMKTLVKKQTVF